MAARTTKPNLVSSASSWATPSLAGANPGLDFARRECGTAPGGATRSSHKSATSAVRDLLKDEAWFADADTPLDNDLLGSDDDLAENSLTDGAFAGFDAAEPPSGDEMEELSLSGSDDELAAQLEAAAKKATNDASRAGSAKAKAAAPLRSAPSSAGTARASAANSRAGSAARAGAAGAGSSSSGSVTPRGDSARRMGLSPRGSFERTSSKKSPSSADMSK